MSDSPSQKPADVMPLVPQSDARWWLPHMKDRRAQAITNCAQGIWTQCEPIRSAGLSAWRLYSNQPLVGSGTQPRLYRRRTMGTVGTTAFSFNVVKAVLDTYVALMLKDLPAVMFQTKGGSASLQRKAQLLEKLVDGSFYDADFYGSLGQLILDSVLFPFAAAQPYEDWSDPDKPRIGIDRTMFWEWIADETDAQDGHPTTPYRVRGMDRLAAMATWPDKAAEILEHGMSLAQFDPSLMGEDGAGLTDRIVVIEAWHKGTGKLDPSGHAICTGSVMLDEPKGQDCEVELLYRLRPTTGMHSSSLALELRGPQRFLNQLTASAQHAMHLTGTGHWLAHAQSNLNFNLVDNQQGSKYTWSGGIEPKFFPGGGLPPALMDLFLMTYTKCFETIGVSMSIAQGQTPQLNGSGKAILAYADVQSQRFKPSYRELQDFVVRIARRVIAVAARISKKHPAFAVKAPGKMMAAVRWADGNLREEEYVMQPKAINKMAEDPVGVLDQVQNFANAGPGWMLPSDGRRLMTNVPDLQAWADEMNAARNLVEQLCDSMLEKGKYIAPDGFLPLDEAKVGPDNAIRWVHLRLLKAQVDGEDETNTDLLRRWLTEAQQIVEEQRPKPAPGLPPGAAMGAPPPALPGQPGAPTQMPQPPPQAAAA